MKSRKLSTSVMVVMMTMLLSLSGGFVIAANDKPMKPEIAAKKENFRKQNEQRVTPEKRKAAVDALKAERLKIYQAKQLHKQSNKVDNDNK